MRSRVSHPFDSGTSSRGAPAPGGIRCPDRSVLGIGTVAIWLFLAGAALGAEKVFDFSAQRDGEPPTGWLSAVTGEGEPGDWRVKEVAVDSIGESSVSVREIVVAQLARDRTDEHFPLLIYGGESFGDFTFSAKVKAVEGDVEQMAGLAFRIVDTTNYYVLRLSARGDTVRFYKVVDGIRSPPIGVSGSVPRGLWHELKVHCQGNQIRCELNGQQLFPALNDNSFTLGRIGLWTKSDSVSYFKDVRVVYQPRETLAERLVQDGLERYRRLLGLELYAAEPGQSEVRLLAGHDAGTVGRLGGKVEHDVAHAGTVYYGKEKGSVSVVMPLRDRNGDPVAAVRVTLKSFPGQTEKNALARAKPIVDRMAAQVRSGRDLFQ